MTRVLVPAALRTPIEAGSVTVLFRRWRRPLAVAGHSYRTAAGRLRVEEVTVVDPAKVSAADARRAGYRTAADLRADLRGEPAWPVFRLAIGLVDGPDPREDLAADDVLDASAVAVITARLDRLDRASTHGPWTREALRMVQDRPAVRAPDLAASVGRETLPFKTDVRKLKNLGLTVSLPVGYRLSPRGAAYLAAVEGAGAS
jgi:hypothetical protein